MFIPEKIRIDCRNCINFEREEHNIMWDYGNHTNWEMQYKTYYKEVCLIKKRRNHKNPEIITYHRKRCKNYIHKNTKLIDSYTT